MTHPVASAEAEPSATAWHALAVEEAVGRLGADPRNGLTTPEAGRRLQTYGANTLEVGRKVPWYRVLARQFVDVLIIILFIAAGVALALGEVVDAVTILIIIVLNGGLGFVQEWRAEQAMEALQRMLAPRCTVVRDGGQATVIEASDLVPGDVVLLDTGDRVPADLRLVEAVNLETDEAPLTGESLPVSKGIRPVAADTPIADRTPMTWMGTTVTNGGARGVVVATGMGTEFGRVAHLTQSVGEEATPLQRKLARLGKQLGIASVALAVGMALTGLLLGRPLLEMFLTGVSLAVAVVPEGLPAVVTITLALGIRAMVRRNALLRRLQAAETLGSATVICTDKTGTLTRNEMTVQRAWLPSGEVAVTGLGYRPEGRFERDGQPVEPGQRPDLYALLETGLRCNRARVFQDEAGWQAVGDPTEAALVVAAAKGGLAVDAEVAAVTEFSFTSARKRMAVVVRRGEDLVSHVKGAPEVVLERCTHIQEGEQTVALTDAHREAVQGAYGALAEQGLRVLALARRTLPSGLTEPSEEEAERGLAFLGMVGILDPPRQEVPRAVRLAATAGIRVLMVTGDAAPTAEAIARRVGLPVRRAITGSEVTAMEDEALRAALSQPVLFARTSPEHKMRIVDMLQEQGQIVAMTGDGVNDAPALKKADIGVSMGIRGTDVAKSASDMVLLDDNFASIVSAVEEGRRQYDNIQKFVRYLLSSNASEVVAVFANILLRAPLILLPVQILWVNLVTNGPTAVALGLERPERDVMERPPRPPRQPMLDRRGVLVIGVIAAYMGAAALWLFHRTMAGGEDAETARTMAFTGLIMLEMVNVFNFRSFREPMPLVGFLSNRWLLVAWVLSVGLQVCAVYVPFLQTALHTTPLSLADWGWILALAVPVFLVGEAYKWWRHSRRKEAEQAA